MLNPRGTGDAMITTPPARKRAGLRARLAILVAATLCPLAAFQGHELARERTQRIEAAVERVHQTTRVGAERFRDAIDEARTTLDLLSHVPAVVGDRPEACREFLMSTQEGRTWATGFFVVDAAGRIVCSTIDRTVGLDVSRRDWYRKTITAGAFTVSDFYVTLTRKKPTVAAARPIANARSGQPPLVLMVDLDLAWFDRLASALGRENGATIFLVDGAGHGLSRYPAMANIVGADLTGVPSVHAALTLEAGFFEGSGIEGRERFYSHQRLPGTDARLIVGLDRETVLAPIDASIRDATVVFIAIATILGGVIWLAGSRVFVAPLQEASEALRKSEGYLRGIVDGSGDCIKVLDLRGNLEFISRNGQCLMEVDDPATVLGQSFVGMWPEAARATAQAKLDEARAGVPAQFDAGILTVKGTPLHVDVLITPINNAKGAPERLVAIARDITHLKRAEAALHNKTHLLETTLASMDQGLIMVDAAGIVTLSNRRAAELLELPADLMASGPNYRRVREHQRRAKRWGVLVDHGGSEWRLDDTCRSNDLRYERRNEDGNVLEIHTLPVDGGGVLQTFTDITHLKRAEEAAELARTRAEEANRAKSDFLATMSHEIRTPLNAIKGFSDLLGDDLTLIAGQRRYVDHVRTASDALLVVVDDILDFAKVEAGRIELEREPLSVHALVDDTVAMVEAQAAMKGLRLAVEIAPDVPGWVIGDVNRLRQVLLNLVNNAVKFTPAGSVTVAVTAAGGSTATSSIRVEVRDTGIGIAADKQHRLFTRFSQTDSGIARRFGGTGLGLAIAKGLIEAMGGSVGVTSAEGTGSTFWFSLALPRSDAVTVREIVPAADRCTDLPRARLLLVEDVAINREIAKAILEREGYTVDLATNGLEAFRAVQEAAYDLVLMDVEMPELDGVATTRAIRALAHPARAVPIVAMTANVLPDSIARFKAAGMNGHVGKPFDRAHLFAVIEASLVRANGSVVTHRAH